MPVFTLLTLAIAAGALYYWHDSAGMTIAVLSLATILLIIFGERFALDRALGARGLPGRDAIIPPIALAIAFAMGAVQLEIIPPVLSSKLQIIILIMSFAILSEGVSRSGFFAFAAYKIVHNCQGNTTTLTLYMYILSSVLTLLTTNDVVTLVMTPVIISICVNAGIRNARLLLLSGFLAANTMSMATLIGSPTNIIFGLGMKITFFTYLMIMILPAILSFMLSLIVLDWVIRQCRGGNRLFKRWSYDNQYKIPAIVHHIQFTQKMKTWLVIFTFSMLLVAVVSGLQLSLLLAAGPIALVSLGMMYVETVRQTGSPAAAGNAVMDQIKTLPYAVFFFGMTFFIFSAQMVRLDFIGKVVLPFIHDHIMNDMVGGVTGTIMATGLLVNTINDLPATAFLTDLFQRIDAAGGMHLFMRIMMIQAVLIGVNIGCYVTPIGALAGLLFFNIIEREERRRRQRHERAVQAGENPPPLEPVAMPDRTDLVRFGIMNFIFVAVCLGVLMPFLAEMLDMLLNSPGNSTKTPLIPMISIYSVLPYLGGGLALLVLMRTRAILEKGNVLLVHMREVFAILTRVTIWSLTNRGLYLGIQILLFLWGASALLFWAETTHDKVYGLAEGEKSLFDSMSTFIIWLMLFTTTGLGGTSSPHSALALAMTSMLPMIVIGGVVLVSNISGEKSVRQLSQKLAKGEIPSYRIVIVNFSYKCEKFVEEALYTRDACVLLLCGAAQYDRAVSFCDRINETAHASHRVYAALKNADSYYNYQEYRMGHADEIYLLSDMTPECEYENLSYLSKLDAAFSADMSAPAEMQKDLASIGLSEADLQGGSGSATTLPRVLIEASSRRFYELMQKSCSRRLLENSVQIMFDQDIAEFLFSDMDESLDMLNAYYRLGIPPADGTLFAAGRNPLEKTAIRAFDLDDTGKKLFQNHFSGDTAGAAAQATADLKALRHVALQVVATLPQATKDARYLDGAAWKEIDYSALLGVVMNISNNFMHLSIPSAAISMQSVAVDKILLREIGGGKTLAAGSPEPKLGKAGNIFIFNLNPESTAFIRILLPVLKDKGRRIVVLCSPSQIVPEDIARNPRVSVLQSAVVEEIVNGICPFHEFQEPGGAPAKHPLLKKGDRLYVFLDYGLANPELPAIDFIDQINRRMQQFDRYAADNAVDPELSHPDVYIAVETHGSDSRFLFENFFIDKIFNASVPRQSYMEIFAKIFHRTLSDKSFVGHTHGSNAEFRRASAMATHLCRFICEYAEDIKLQDATGAEIRLPDKSYQDAVRHIGAYSMPPMQLFARVRLEAAHQDRAGFHKTFQLTAVDDSEPIREGDLLLNIPII